MLIDLHCHLLPNVDDGPKTLEESLALAKVLVEQKVEHVLCTPHLNNKYYNPANKVIHEVTMLQKELDKRKIPLTLYEGQEVRISGTLLEDIARGEILFTDLSNRYLLIEFPSGDIPAYTQKLFFDLMSQGHIPIIVHPERNAKFIEDPNLLLPFLEMGVLTQLTAPSYIGVFGSKIAKTAKQMVKHNMIHMVASDAHNTGRRGVRLQEAFEAIAKDSGVRKVSIMKQTAKDILNGDDVIKIKYSEVKRKMFGVF